MATPKVMSGARAKVSITYKGESQPRTVGIFSDISYGYSLNAQPAFILGSFVAQAIEYVSQEVVHISATGWRVIGHGKHTDGGLPKIQDLLTAEYIEFTIFDRAQEASGGQAQRIGTIRNVRPVGASEAYSTGQLSSTTFSYIGIWVDDETSLATGAMAEHPSAAVMP